MIIEYSVKKIIEKDTPLYSTLNPETSSDSPSAKSKGVRPNSAKIEIKKIPLKGTQNKKKHTYTCFKTKYSILKEVKRKINLKKIIINITS